MKGFIPLKSREKKKKKRMFQDAAIKKVTNGKKTKLSELTIKERILVELECERQVAIIRW